ncbi:hypothetical protein [Enhygromyxa salina]|nr:hypothetical protein [Enhygromyxa salina]
MLSLDQLICLVQSGKYAGDLQHIQIGELWGSPNVLAVQPGETDEAAILRLFRLARDQWLSSGFFVRHLGLNRWTAQKLCADLAERGLLLRRGLTSGTRYRLADSASIGSEV